MREGLQRHFHNESGLMSLLHVAFSLSQVLLKTDEAQSEVLRQRSKGENSLETKSAS